jgi:D-alanyl-D-alanine carboxypeptidase
MSLRTLFTTIKSCSKIKIILSCAFACLLAFLLCFSLFRSGGQKNSVPVVDTGVGDAVQLPGRENSGDGSSGEELPDLAETIAHLFRETAYNDPDREAFVEDFWRWIFGEAGIPERISRKVAASALESPAFIMELLMLLQEDPFACYLVDKQHSLPEGYEPNDLVTLTAGSYRLSRDGLMLRRSAVNALHEMAAAATAEGIVLTVGSAYRSAEYQAQLYEREVRTYGREIADRESAQPGKSQHQLGLVVDFAPIEDDFAKTPAAEWLLRNAEHFGWSLSYPDGYEEITGYRWESWHYRYVGKSLATFIRDYFDGIQQYALRFIHAWQEQTGE